MLFNISNHKFENWTDPQKEKALKLFGKVVDISFPNVDPEEDEKYVHKLGDEIINRIFELAPDNFFDINCFVMGEAGLSYNLVSRLKAIGIPCYYSTTQRKVTEEIVEGKVIKKSEFEFVRFRQYL